MKLQKWLALSLSALMTASLLAGCGGTPASTGGSTPASAGSGSSEATEPVNIVWAGWSGEEEATKDIFQRMRTTYEEASGNTVTWVGWTWADTAQQLLIRNQGSEQLDLAQVDIGIFNTVAQAGVLADWNDILGEEYLKENFTQSALDVGNVDGKQLALPWSMASITMVYNPEILARAGWDTVPTTMEEFEQCLADVAALGEGIVPYGVSTKDATCAGDFMPWLWTFGGAIYGEDGSVTINSEAAVECVKRYQDMLVIFEKSEYKEQAADLALTLVSDEVAMDYFTNNGMPPVTTSASEKEEVKSDAYLNGFIQSTATARPEETARMTNANEVKSVITEELQYALLGQKTAEQAVADMESRLNAL